MILIFKGKFEAKTLGALSSVLLEAKTDTARPLQPNCIGIASGSDEALTSLRLGMVGEITGKTVDRQQTLRLRGVTLVRQRSLAGGQREAEFEFRNLELRDARAEDFINFPSAAVKCRWWFSGEPALNRWLRASGAETLASCLGEIVESNLEIRAGVEERTVKVDWEPDGLRRAETRCEPFVECVWPAGSLSVDDYHSAVDTVDSSVSTLLLSAGFCLDCPVIVWQRDIDVLQVGEDLLHESQRLVRRMQYLGQAPLFRADGSAGPGGDLDAAVAPERLRRLAEWRGHLEPALKSYLWGPTLPLETEFITTCTALEALKEWYLVRSDTQSTYTSTAQRRAAEKRIKVVVSEVSSGGGHTVPLEEVLQKITELGRPSFRWALKSMAEDYGIRLAEEVGEGDDPELNLSFIGTRNKLVHTGAIPEQGKLKEGAQCARTLCRLLLEAVLSKEWRSI